MLEKDVEKRFDSTEFLSDNLIVHLPRVEGAERPAYQVRPQFIYGTIRFSNFF